jgi:hypothetical protein
MKQGGNVTGLPKKVEGQHERRDDRSVWPYRSKGDGNGCNTNGAESYGLLEAA